MSNSENYLTVENGVLTKCDKYSYLYANRIVIPKGVTEIGNSAFYGNTRIKSITIPDGVTEIGNSAFARCTLLESITIPDSVTTIGESAFSRCVNLKSITIPKGVKYIGNRAFADCTSIESVTIPDGVTEISEFAFRGCVSLELITIPDSVTKIEKGAFGYCKKLFSITIPDSVTKIGIGVFSDCNRLGSITIPDSVTEIGIMAFDGRRITLSENNPAFALIDGILYSKDKKVLLYCSSWKKEIPDSVTKIERYAFYNFDSLDSGSLRIPDSVTEIGIMAFNGCKIIVSENNPKFASMDGVLYSKDKKVLLYYPGSKENNSFEIPDSVTEISEFAFDYCPNLKSITIPDSVTKILPHTFLNCPNLHKVVYSGKVLNSIGDESDLHGFYSTDWGYACDDFHYGRLKSCSYYNFDE